jgi:hypothetical protein
VVDGEVRDGSTATLDAADRSRRDVGVDRSSRMR